MRGRDEGRVKGKARVYGRRDTRKVGRESMKEGPEVEVGSSAGFILDVGLATP